MKKHPNQWRKTQLPRKISTLLRQIKAEPTYPPYLSHKLRMLSRITSKGLLRLGTPLGDRGPINKKL